MDRSLSEKMNWIVISLIGMWFSASIVSQALYIGFNGRPYDAMFLVSILGPWYGVILVVEIMVWLGVAHQLVARLARQDDGQTISPAR